MSELRRFGSEASAEIVEAALEQDGAAIVDDLVPGDCIARAQDELEFWLSRPVDQSLLPTNIFTGFKTLRTSALIRKSRACGELAMNPLILSVMDRILGPQCSRFQLSFTQAIVIGPGEQAQILHRDTGMYPFSRPGPEVFVNVIWAGTRFTSNNGGTVVVPGSHRWPDARVPGEGDSRAYTEMAPGSCLIYYGSVYHGGGANLTTDERRIALGMGYTLGWLRQEENQYIAVPPDVAKDLPIDLQRLIGYSGHYPFLGWWEGQDRELDRDRHRKNYGTTLVGKPQG